MKHTASLSAKLVRIGAGLLVVALISIGLTLWVTWKLSGGAAALNEAGRMRMQTWRLTSEVQAQLPAAHIEALTREFDSSMQLLKNGDASRPPQANATSPPPAGLQVAIGGQRHDNFGQVTLGNAMLVCNRLDGRHALLCLALRAVHQHTQTVVGPVGQSHRSEVLVLEEDASNILFECIL